MSDKSDQSPQKPADGAPSPIGEISQEPSAFEQFLDSNQKRLMIAAIIGILAVVAYVIYKGVTKMRIEEAAAEVSSARTVPELEKAHENHEGTNAGGSALIFKSETQWRDQQQKEAMETLEKFIESYPEHPVIGNAKARLGSYHQQLGNPEKSRELFREAADSKTSISSYALLMLGDLARNEGKDEEARDLYNQIIDDYPDHPSMVGLAKNHMELLGFKLPVDAPPEPTPPVPGSTGAASSPVRITPGTSTQPITIPPTPTAPDAPDSPAPAETTETPAPGEAEEVTEPPSEEVEEGSENGSSEAPSESQPE